jgi:hypothetical protein
LGSREQNLFESRLERLEVIGLSRPRKHFVPFRGLRNRIKEGLDRLQIGFHEGGIPDDRVPKLLDLPGRDLLFR